MNEEVRLSRLRVSRRRALAIGGTVGLSGVLAACATAGDAPSGGAATTTAVVTDPAALLDVANTCILAEEKGQGPYWFDVDSIRSDIRDGRPGLTLALALRVHDVSSCSVGGPVKPVPNAVVEIWHCDAGGVYSGFARGPRRRAVRARPSPSRRDLATARTAAATPEATPTDAAPTYLRGAQAVDANGIVRFTTIFPGWYVGRTTHIHCKVHIDRRTVLTTQLYFDDNLTDEIYLPSRPTSSTHPRHPQRHRPALRRRRADDHAAVGGQLSGGGQPGCRSVARSEYPGDLDRCPEHECTHVVHHRVVAWFRPRVGDRRAGARRQRRRHRSRHRQPRRPRGALRRPAPAAEAGRHRPRRGVRRRRRRRTGGSAGSTSWSTTRATASSG